LRIDLSGKQPERCELLVQFVALSPGESCRFRFSYQTSVFPAESGLQWRLPGAAGPQLSSVDWKRAELNFSTHSATMARFVLEYNRTPGTSRLEGWISLRDVELACPPQKNS